MHFPSCFASMDSFGLLYAAVGAGVFVCNTTHGSSFCLKAAWASIEDHRFQWTPANLSKRAWTSHNLQTSNFTSCETQTLLYASQRRSRQSPGFLLRRAATLCSFVHLLGPAVSLMESLRLAVMSILWTMSDLLWGRASAQVSTCHGMKRLPSFNLLNTGHCLWISVDIRIRILSFFRLGEEWQRVDRDVTYWLPPSSLSSLLSS